MASSESDIKYATATVEEHDQILDFIRIHYYREEPITIGHPEKKQTADDEKFSMSFLSEHTVFKATDGITGELVGVLISGAIKPGDVEEMLAEAETTETKKWSDILKLLAYREGKADVCRRFNVEKSLHVQVMGVDPSHRGKSIGVNLLKFAMAKAKELGFKMLSIDCTSVYSIALAEKLKLECVSVVAFADYRNDEGVVLFNPPSPHTHIKSFIQRL